MTVLVMSTPLQEVIFSCISSILLIGNLKFKDIDGEAVNTTEVIIYIYIYIYIMIMIHKNTRRGTVYLFIIL